MHLHATGRWRESCAQTARIGDKRRVLV
jgi:hypothetical protein